MLYNLTSATDVTCSTRLGDALPFLVEDVGSNQVLLAINPVRLAHSTPSPFTVSFAASSGRSTWMNRSKPQVMSHERDELQTLTTKWQRRRAKSSSQNPCHARGQRSSSMPGTFYRTDKVKNTKSYKSLVLSSVHVEIP